MKLSGFAVAAAVLATTLPASGQRIAEWPVRLSASPEAITAGLAGIFWNPAALETTTHLREVLLLDQRTPDVLGLNGVAGAAAVRLERTTFGVALQHVGIDDIALTTESPIDSAGGFSVSENEFVLSAAHALTDRFSIGATARYSMVDYDGGENQVAIGVGTYFRPLLPFSPAFGAFALNRGDEIRWGAGAEVQTPIVSADYTLRVNYGLMDEEGPTGANHWFGSSFDWRNLVSMGGSLIRTEEAEGASWMPLLAASLRLNRYTLGVVRESLANDFGAAYSFRLQVGF